MSEREFLERIRQTLDDGAEALDDATAARLQRARRDAISRATTSRRRRIAVGGLAAAAASALLAVGLWLEEPGQTTLPPILDDVELLSTAEDLEFYENLEFFYWLEEG